MIRRQTVTHGLVSFHPFVMLARQSTIHTTRFGQALKAGIYDQAAYWLALHDDHDWH